MTALDEMVNVRYMVDDVDAALDFYTTHLGFEVRTNAAPAFADVTRGRLRLLLNVAADIAAATIRTGRNLEDRPQRCTQLEPGTVLG